MMKIYRCIKCGYIYQDDKAPAECPICHHPQSDFEEINEDNVNFQMLVESRNLYISWMNSHQYQEKISLIIVAYAARAGLELGADMVKIKYSGSKKSFEWAVKAAGKTKVVLSGGPKVSEKGFLEVVRNVIGVGAVGVAVGRNVWQHQDPLAITEKLKRIIFVK